MIGRSLKFPQDFHHFIAKFVCISISSLGPSFSEWIECKIALVRPDGKLKLEHTDGTGVLKALVGTSIGSSIGRSKPPIAGKSPMAGIQWAQKMLQIIS